MAAGSPDHRIDKFGAPNAATYGEQIVSNQDRAAGKLSDVVQDMSQRTIDIICSDEVLKLFPVVKFVVAGTSAIQGVRDEILNKKLETFLETLSEVPAAERREMVDRLESDPDYRRKVGEHIIEVLDRLESYRKPKITGEIFAAFARKKIDRIMFQRLLTVIDRLPAVEIDTVRRFVNSSNSQPERDLIDQESIQAMVNAGLVSTERTSPIGGGRTVYFANMTCQKFVELNLDVKSRNNA